MSFDYRDIRPSMDVYTLDNSYLGTVLSIQGGPALPQKWIPPTSDRGSSISGELLGPMPTQPIGNPASLKQSAVRNYATAEDTMPIGAGTIVVGRWWGLAGRRVIPLSDVQTVSLERVVLRQRMADLA